MVDLTDLPPGERMQAEMFLSMVENMPDEMLGLLIEILQSEASRRG